jgi:hypothetical protein
MDRAYSTNGEKNAYMLVGKPEGKTTTWMTEN